MIFIPGRLSFQEKKYSRKNITSRITFIPGEEIIQEKKLSRMIIHSRRE